MAGSIESMSNGKELKYWFDQLVELEQEYGDLQIALEELETRKQECLAGFYELLPEKSRSFVDPRSKQVRTISFLKSREEYSIRTPEERQVLDLSDG